MKMLKVILEEGVVFLCVGMGVVCLFLSVMVWLMMLSSKVSAWLGRFFPEAVPEVKVKKTNGTGDAELAAVIAIAAAQG